MEKVLNTSANKDDVIFFGYRDRETLKHGPLQRPIDEKTVADLAEDIKINGVINPILVKREGDGWFSIITGHHRWEAICRVWDTVDQDSRAAFNIQARGTFIKPEHVELVQIAENLIRNDLSKEERSVMAGRYGELIGTSASGGSKKGGGSKSGGGGKKGPDKTAFTEWRIGANMAEKTAMRRWEEYCLTVGLNEPPGNRTHEELMPFFNWLAGAEERRKQAEDERKRLSDEDAAKKKLEVDTEIYQKAQGVYLRACDVATKAGVPNVKYI